MISALLRVHKKSHTYSDIEALVDAAALDCARQQGLLSVHSIEQTRQQRMPPISLLMHQCYDELHRQLSTGALKTFGQGAKCRFGFGAELS